MVPDALVRDWEMVYGEYIRTGNGLRSEVLEDIALMTQMSAEIAAIWRRMAEVPGVPWWTVAALCTAADAFERQALEWSRGRRLELFKLATEQAGELNPEVRRRHRPSGGESA